MPGKVLLIVEDDQLLQRMYEKIFKFEKYDVHVASDGEDGLEQARSLKPVLILLDVMMPKLNGIEVLKKLKADSETEKIPVVMLTNLAGDKDVETALAIGAVKYIIKSDHTPKEVADMVKEIITAHTRDEVPATAEEK